MISVRYRLQNGQHRLHITGHAGYAPAGSDIVCAGVSALACALTGFLRGTEGGRVLRRTSGELLLTCPAGDRTDAAVELALTGFRQIAGTYPRYAEVDISTNTP